jgi:transcriptional regulator with XRE-family HTH domain
MVQRELKPLVEVAETKTISSWERGHSVPRGRKLMLLAQALGCSVEWLLYGDTEPDAEEPTDVRVVRAVRDYEASDPTATLLTPGEIAVLRRVHLGAVEPTQNVVRALALALVEQRR